MYTWVALKENVKLARILWKIFKSMFESRILLVPWRNLPEAKTSGKLEPSTFSSWSYDMEGHAEKCVEINCELANKTTQQ